MTAKKRSILLSILTLMLCLALVAVGTYALFTDSVTLDNHLKAGNLNVTLTRTSLTTKTLDKTTGFLVDNPVNNEVVDFSDATERNVFDIDEKKDLIVPQCSYAATMKIENKSDVAFKYWIEVVLKSATNELAEQLDVTVTTTKGTSARLDKGVYVGSKDAPIGVVAVNESQTFIISVTFVDNDKVNNDAMGDKVDFDIVVHAVQETENPNP